MLQNVPHLISQFTATNYATIKPLRNLKPKQSRTATTQLIQIAVHQQSASISIRRQVSVFLRGVSTGFPTMMMDRESARDRNHWHWRKSRGAYGYVTKIRTEIEHKRRKNIAKFVISIRRGAT